MYVVLVTIIFQFEHHYIIYESDDILECSKIVKYFKNIRSIENCIILSSDKSREYQRAMLTDLEVCKILNN